MKRNPLLFTVNVDRLGDRVVGALTRVPTAIAVIAGTYVCLCVCVQSLFTPSNRKRDFELVP